MSPDEVFATTAAMVVGPMLWMLSLFQLSRVDSLHRGRQAVTAIAVTLAACAGLLYLVLRTGASFDVVDSPPYQFMYVVLGLAWLRAAEVTFAYLGLSPRDDLVERGNKAAIAAVVGALVGVTFCYAGGNIGDGPGWWVVLFSAALATVTLIATWALLTRLSPVADSVTIDRDPAAGVRLGTFLAACGIILGRGVAGDWHSAWGTVIDLAPALPAVAAILVLAVAVERFARPTGERPHAPFVALGVLPSLLYLMIAARGVWARGWPM